MLAILGVSSVINLFTAGHTFKDLDKNHRTMTGCKYMMNKGCLVTTGISGVVLGSLFIFEIIKGTCMRS